MIAELEPIRIIMSFSSTWQRSLKFASTVPIASADKFILITVTLSRFICRES
jgi:hypothetical protein